MSDQPVMVSKFSWDEVFPWTLIFKTLPIAASFTVLIFATLGVFATPMGWIVAEKVFSNETVQEDARFVELMEVNRSPYLGLLETGKDKEGSFKILGVALSGPKLVFQRFLQPFRQMFAGGLGFRKFGYLLVGCVWTLLVWAFFGTAITRVCLLRLCRDEEAGLDDGIEYSIANFTTCLGALLMPLCAVALLTIPNFFIGLLLSFDVGTIIGGLIWFVVLGVSFCIAVLLLGLMFGWPLMVASVSCEGQNALDAMTRSFAYTFQRPLNYLFYSAIAVLFGGFCWVIVSKLAIAVIGLGFWTTSWGANTGGADRMEIIRGERAEMRELETSSKISSETESEDSILNDGPTGEDRDRPMRGEQIPPEQFPVQRGVQRGPVLQGEPPRGPGRRVARPQVGEQVGTEPQTAEPIGASVETGDSGKQIGIVENAEEVTGTTSLPANTRSLEIGKWFINFWTSFARTVAAAFLYGLFWCMASAIYLLLRYDVDESEMDEIYQVDERRTFELPPLASDENGIPQVQTPRPVEDSETNSGGDSDSDS